MFTIDSKILPGAILPAMVEPVTVSLFTLSNKKGSKYCIGVERFRILGGGGKVPAGT